MAVVLFLTDENAYTVHQRCLPVARDREKRVASFVRLERNCVGVERRLDHLQTGVLVDKGQANLKLFRTAVVAYVVLSKRCGCCRPCGHTDAGPHL